MEMIPRSPCSSLRLLLAPPGIEPDYAQRLDFPRALGEGPPPPTWVLGSSRIPPFDATTGEQVKDKLDILYGLVFELRQGVEDLQFRLQLLNDKVTLFLHLLSSLHETFLSTPEEETFKQAPDADTADGEAKVSATSTQGHDATTTTGDVVMQCATEMYLKRTGSATMAEKDTVGRDRGAEAKEEAVEKWGDGTTIVEEEPWTGKINATWPGYASGV
jgi:hypothetical protein